MKKIAIIGFGTIGKKLYEQICHEGLLEVAYIYEPTVDIPHHFDKVDLVVETAVPQVVEEYGREIVKHAHFMPLSITALSNQRLYDDILDIASAHQHQLFIPHGAILGLDGIFDGRMIFDSVQIVTIKNPKSLNRNDTGRVTVFEGSAREVAKLMPRNVNVHAALALAGIGFDKTKSILVSDPATKENTHIITAKNGSTTIEIVLKSNPVGAVTGAYTPISAYGSVKRALGIAEKNMIIV
jgi:aspartate dehydrogenase